MLRLYLVSVTMMLSTLACFSLSATPAAEAHTTVEQIEQQAKESKDYQRALHQLLELVQREPRNAKAYMTAGQILEARGFGILAEQLYQQADKCDPSGPESNLRTFYLKLHEEGVKAAADYLGYVVERFPDDPGVLLMQGMIARLNKHYLEAEYYYQRALKQYPKMPGSRTALASLAMLRGKYSEAMHLINEELKLHPNDIAAVLAQGQIYIITGKHAQALPCLTKAYEYQTTSAAVDKRAVANLLMSTSAALGKNADALEYGLEILAKSNTREDAKTILHVKRKLRPVVRALPEAEILNIETIVEGSCSTPVQKATVRFALADLLDIEKKAEAAKVMYRKGLEIMPSAARGHYRLATRLIKDRDYANGYIYARQSYCDNQADSSIVNTYVRMNSRLNNRKRDIAWGVKDWLRGGAVTDLDSMQPLLYQQQL